MNDRLVFTDIHRTFGRLHVLRGASGCAEAGSTLLVRGGNGSGKSTLLRVLAGLLAAERGDVEQVEAGARLDLAGRRRRIGYVAPDLAFDEELTVGETLAFFARLRRLPGDRAEAARREVELPAGRRVGALSSGMRQRLRWAFALLHRPVVLLLDEPFQNLDLAGEELGRALLAGHLERGGLAVVASPVAMNLPGLAATVDLGTTFRRPGEAAAAAREDGGSGTPAPTSQAPPRSRP
jgi:heme exporter protein A